MAYASVTYTSASGTTFALTNSNGDPIPYIRQSDIKVYVNTVLQTLTTDYTFNTAGTAIVLNSAVSGATVLLQRITDIADPTVVYTAGSTLTAQDLNNADNQIRYGLQEFQDSVDAGGGVPDGDKGDISVGGNGTIWTVDNGAVTEAKIASGAVTETKIGTGAVTSTKIANDTIVDADINSAAAITLSKLGTGALPTTITVASANIVDGTIVDVDISASAEIAVSKLADGTARQLLQTDAAGTGVEWASNIDIPGTLDVTGNTTLDGDLTIGGSFNVTSLNGGPLAGSRNRIINGDMRIDQRNAGASVTPADQQYTLDRWVYIADQASKCTIEQTISGVSAPAGFTDYLGVTSTAATTITASQAFAVIQRVEGYNMADFAWGTASAATVTLSFWVRSSLTGTFGGALRNDAGNYNYPFSYTISAANTWEQKSVTITGPTSGTWLTTNGRGMQVVFSLGAGSSVSGTAGAWSTSSFWSATGATQVLATNGATFYITGVQLEPGTVATPFERRSYGQELALCQRYYCEQQVEGQTNSGSILYRYNFPVAMRAAPTQTNKTAGTFTNASVNNELGNVTTAGFYFQMSVSAANGFIVGRVNAYSAEL